MEIAENALCSWAGQLLVGVEVLRNNVALVEVLKQLVFQHHFVIFLPFSTVQIAAARAAKGAEYM